MSVVVGISAEEEAEHHRVGMPQLLAASQWGVTLMWQKGIISLETLKCQAVIKHCLDLIPFCRMETRNWLNDLLGSLTTTTQGPAGNAQAFDARLAS